jgi:hypothetical protein
MAPGHAECHCTVCGVTCKGRFAGCAGVWARGAQPVVLKRIDVSVNGGRSAHNGVAGNGLAALPVSPLEAPQRGGASREQVAQVVQDEVKRLVGHLDQMAEDNKISDLVAAVTSLSSELSEMPDRIARALGVVLAHDYEILVKRITDALETFRP